MEIKEKIVDELKIHIDTFEKYDNKITKDIENREKRYQERKKEFDEKWDGDIFPADIPIKDKEEQRLEQMKNSVKMQRQKLDDEIKDAEQKLKSSVKEWINEIDERRDELVQYANDKNKYLKEKSLLEKELKSQIEGIQMWEKNGINSNDSVYRRRKEEIIPNLKSKIKDIDLKLDETNIRKEYKELGELKKEINDVKLHDRKHILPELADIFEINKIKPEPVKPEPVKPEPVKPEPVKPEPVKPEPVKPEPVKPEPVKPEPVKPEPVKPEPVKPEPVKPESAKPEPAKPEPVKPEPVKPEPAKPESAKPEPAKPEPVKPVAKNENIEPFVKLIIGRKIKVKYLEDGAKFTAVKSKEYFKYMKTHKNGVDKINSQLCDMIGIEKANNEFSIENVDPIIVYSLLKGLEQDFFVKEDVINAVKAISNKDKESLDKAIPIEVNKKSLSIYSPWNRRFGKKINEFANQNKDLIDSIGEYEPNVLKRFFKPMIKSLKLKEEPALLTDGEEELDYEEQKNEKKKLNERKDIKMSKAFNEFSTVIDQLKTTGEAKAWCGFLEEDIANGQISKEEAEVLKESLKKQLEKIKNKEKGEHEQETKGKEPEKQDDGRED